MKNTTKALIIIIPCLCFAGFGVWTATISKQVKPSRKPVNPIAANTTENPNVLTGTSNTPVSAGNPSASEMLDALSKRKPGEVPQVERKPLTNEEQKKRKQEWIDRDMKNRRNELNAKNVIYSALYDRLKLPNEILKTLKDLLVDLEFADTNVSMKYFDLDWNLTKNDRNKNINDYRDNVKANIKDLLNDEYKSAYALHYLETLYQREEANNVNDYFKGRAESLTPEQTDALVDILYNRIGIGDAAGITVADNNYYAKIYALQGQYTVEKAAGILTPTQLAALKGFYDARVKRASRHN